MSRYDIALKRTIKIKETRYEGTIPELMELRRVGNSKFYYCPYCNKTSFALIRFGFKQDNPLKRFFHLDGKGKFYAIYRCRGHCRLKYYTYVFDNFVWRCVDIVCETRWDCKTGLGRAQYN